MRPFRPEPYSDFAEPANEAAYRLAVEGIRAQLGALAPVIISGERIDTGTTLVSVDPAEPTTEVGTAVSADEALAERALRAAWGAFADWGRTPAANRAQIVHRLGDLMAERKYELAAWMTFESGKNWAEAEADAAEAIDFCRYYAWQALAMERPVEVHQVPGEANESYLRPLGVGAVIPPWNFPLAILAGMTVGPVAAGNTVVLKPASNTPIIAARFVELAEEAGVPPGVINLVPGPGSEIGDTLVDSLRTRFVNFTGSKEVGIRIGERSAIVHAGQKWLKRAYMEMGGKDAIVVDASADLYAAADGIIRSAYGFQGQKCSACSRLIVENPVHDALVDIVTERVAALDVGPPAENHAVGPVISAVQHASILEEIDRGRSEAKLVMGGNAIERDGGYYIEPTVFTEVAPGSRLGQHEIFGPVLSVIRAADFDEAIRIANATEFGLTGGLYSTDEGRIAQAERDFEVGNLYINRKITGALVGVQPFGGFKLSGSNAKAGGPDYLRLFMEMKSVARRID